MNNDATSSEVASNKNEKTIEKFNKLLENSGYGFKQYQYDGAEWCTQCEASNRGGIYADEMGLGKTFTMIAVMFINFKRRTLIVLPPVLIEQWIKELYKCTGHKPLVYHGTNKNKNKITQEDLERAPIVITSYSMLLPKRKTQQIAETPLHKIKWSRIIFDEAHHLRNSQTTRFKACDAIMAPIRWLVTGTPIQNRRRDFYSLCKIVGLKSEFYTNPDSLEVIRNNYMIKRTKEQVGILLPPIITHHEKVEWQDQAEKKLSEEIHSLLPNQTNVTSNYISGVLADSISSSTENYKLLAILKARQSCILPALIKPTIKNIQKETAKGKALEVISESEDVSDSEQETDYEDEVSDSEQETKKEEYNKGANYSSKLDAVINRILQRKDNGNGKIIFCHFKDEIDFVANKLLQGGLQKVVTYDGRNSKKGVKNISDVADAIVIQIQTGCEGLNLQQNFSEIYFISPHWNPSVEDQAVARCHRIGQVKPTNVFKFEMSSFDLDADQDEEHQPTTLENYVSKVQKNKRELYL
jgi:SNF2 family DNA or RNA helicase